MCNLFILDPIWLSAIAAVVYAFFTGWMIWEIRKDRKLAYKPIINEIFDDTSSYYPDKLAFKLKNVGKGPALNPKMKCVDDIGNRWKLEKEILPIGSLETISVEFFLEKKEEMVAREVLKEKVIFIEIEYKDIFDELYSERVKIPRTVAELLNTRALIGGM